MLRNKDIFSQIFCVFFVRSGTSGTTLVYKDIDALEKQRSLMTLSEFRLRFRIPLNQHSHEFQRISQSKNLHTTKNQQKSNQKMQCRSRLIVLKWLCQLNRHKLKKGQFHSCSVLVRKVLLARFESILHRALYFSLR